MPITPEDRARQNIDKLLTDAGWLVQDKRATNLSAGRGVAVREFPLKSGHGEADYLLFLDGSPIGVVEAKQEGTTLTGVELQTTKYSEGVPDNLTTPRRPLPFQYQSTGVETRFTNLLEPDACSRSVFAFHKPETLDQWLTQELQHPGSTLRARLRSLPPLNTEGLRPAQITAIRNLEKSLAQGRPRALIQMASGGGKTFTACNFIYRLIKHAGAKRILFLVDRSNLARQAEGEFKKFRTPEENRLFTELYNVQRMQSNKLDDVSKVCITTIQRLYAMLQGKEIDPELEEQSGYETSLMQKPLPVSYNPYLPIETFDFIVTDECHRSIYNVWRQVLEYFDAFTIGLTATPSKQTFGFFNQNLVMEYSHDQAVADSVNVGFEVYRIRTLISEHGSTVNAGFYIDKRDKLTRKVRWQQLDEDFNYSSNELDRSVVAKDQIRTVIQAFRDRLFTDIFPGRTEVPKTLIFAKDDSHADDIVQILREEFGKGNDFAQKITYRTGTARVVTKKKTAEGDEVEEVEWKNTGAKPEHLLSSFRNSYNPRIAVTVDMIATGTDIKPLEIVFFMRSVRSRNFFEQMKGRGTRVVESDELKAVTPDASSKTHFIIVDAVGLCEEKMSDTRPLERKRHVSFEKLLEEISFGNREPDALSSLAARLGRLERELTDADRTQIKEVAGEPLPQITNRIVQALDPDAQREEAQKTSGNNKEEPTSDQLKQAATKLIQTAAHPIASNPKLRNTLIEIRRSYEQTIDTVSKDELIHAGHDPAAMQKAQSIVQSFEQFIRENKNEITALQVLYSRPYRQRLTLKEIDELAKTIERPPRAWTADRLWHAYQALDRSKVRGSGHRVLADLVSLVRFAMREQSDLHPFRDDVHENFAQWMAQQESNGRKFTGEQRQWLEAIRDHVAASLTIEPDDFDLQPLVQRGGLGKAYQVFGKDLEPILKELNEVLVQ